MKSPIVELPDHGITVMAATQACYTRDIALLRRALEILGQSDTWQQAVTQVERQLARR